MLIWSPLLQYPPTSDKSKFPCKRCQTHPLYSTTMSRSLLASRQWLPIRQRVTFQLVGLVYRSLHETSPTYLSSFLHANTPTRSLRSSSTHLPAEPRLITELPSRGFRSAGPRIWNSNLELSSKWYQTCSLFILVQIQTQNSPIYYNSSITLRASGSTSYSILQMFSITLHY